MQKLNNSGNIFSQRDCLSKEELIGYAKGMLPKKEKHYVEKHLLDCELCTDALEGIMELEDPGYMNTIHDDMINRMGEKKIELKKNKSAWYLAAAALAVFLLSGIYFKFIRNSENLKSNYANLPSTEEKIKATEPAGASITDSSLLLNETANQTAAFNKQAPLTVVDREPKTIRDVTGAISGAKDMNEMQAEVTSPAPVIYSDAISTAEEKTNESSLDDKKADTELKKMSVDESTSIETGSGTVQTTATETQYRNKSAAAMQLQKEKPSGQKQNINDKLNDAQQNMKRENFKEALQDLNVVLEQNPLEVDALYNTGLVYYKMNDNANALSYFDKTLVHPDKKYFEDARWNKALTYIKMNDKTNARKVISQIISGKSPYKKRAEDLLEEMGGD